MRRKGETGRLWKILKDFEDSEELQDFLEDTFDINGSFPFGFLDTQKCEPEKLWGPIK